MKLCRFDNDRLGVVEDDRVRDVSAALDCLPQQRWPLALGDPVIRHLSAVRGRIAELLHDAPAIPLHSVKLNSPVANPSKIIGAPINYKAHKDEIDDSFRHGHQLKPISEWGLFLKANSALIGPGDRILRRELAERTDHEVELAVVIGRGGSNIAKADAMVHVAGYAIGLDITARGPQFQSFRKSVDTYAVLGPWLVTSDELGDPSDLAIGLNVNGDVRQAGRTSQMIYDVPRLIEFASSYYTLYPGDVIMTGTPDGVGPIIPGDHLHAWIENVGEMTLLVGTA